MRTESAVSVRGLTKRYGARTVVQALDIELPSGVVAGFVGPNGAGKTTTMSMLLGLVRPSGGTGTVLGRRIEQPAAYLREVGALIEGPAFHPALTGRQNLRMLATIAGFEQDRIPALLELVGLGERGEDRFKSYSLGMKQRLGIAAALLGEPQLLILDEPSNGLDPQGVREMRELIGRLAAGGRTVLVSSHDLSELEQVCDWLLLIDTGRSVYQGPTADLLDSATGSLVVGTDRRSDLDTLVDLLAGAGLRFDQEGDRLLVDLGSADAGSLGAEVNRLAWDAGITLVELSPVRTTLEDRYLSLVQSGGDR